MNKQPKFLVDLKNRVYLSDKPHQDIIDENGLDPAGYDNYFKGWVYESDAKVWVEQIEDLVYRYWDQAKVGFKKLVDETILTPASRAIAVVDRHDRPAGTVGDFLGLSHGAFADNRLGHAAFSDIRPGYKAGARFRLTATVRIGPDRYLLRGVEGKLLKDIHGHPPQAIVRWARTASGALRPKSAISHPVDMRILLPIG